jgi:hypothetical protein
MADYRQLAQELTLIQEILKRNSEKNFVQRIVNRAQYPVLDRPDIGSGWSSTHSMAWDIVDGIPIVYPTVIQPLPGSPLKMLNQGDAVRHAMKNKEYIEFDSPQMADWFSRNYKKAWADDTGLSFQKYAQDLQNMWGK